MAALCDMRFLAFSPRPTSTHPTAHAAEQLCLPGAKPRCGRLALAVGHHRLDAGSGGGARGDGEGALFLAFI